VQDKRDLQKDLEICEAATPGPWEVGVYYFHAGVNDGTHPNWNPPKEIKKGQCTFCANKDAELVKTYKNEKGESYHIHKIYNYNWHIIASAATYEKIIGNYDYDEGGVCSTPEDAKFIAEAREGWPHAIKRALEAETELEVYRELYKKDMDGAFKKINQLQAENAKLRETLKNVRQEIGMINTEHGSLNAKCKLNALDIISQALNPKPTAYITDDEDDGNPD